MEHLISNKKLTIKQLDEIIHNPVVLKLSKESRDKINACREYLNKKFDSVDSPATYGVNTGFGSLCNTHIAAQDLDDLQYNLLVSHACGTGDRVSNEVVRLMLFLKIQSLSYGYSGVSIELIERLIAMFNNEVYPVVYEQGSLGASGDLAPLAHLALPLVGEGLVELEGEVIATSELYKKLKWKPIKLKSKEGLALINGTQFMLAYGVFNLIKSHKLWYWSHITAAISLDAFQCNESPYNEAIHLIRPHEGQLRSASLIRELIDGSAIAAQEKDNVQDPYSFRCVPQVHGASWDTLKHVKKVIMTEVNSVTDNPNIFPQSDSIISGGNFHGQPLALVIDYLSIAMAELGNIAERRIFQLMSGTRGLPAFLTTMPGLHSGMMIIQYTAASIVSQNKQLANPASTDSIVSSNGQEDHVSMGANAATKNHKLVDNIQTILAIELLAGCQALDSRKLATSEFLSSIKNVLRADVSRMTEDRVLSIDIALSRKLIEQFSIEKELLY